MGFHRKRESRRDICALTLVREMCKEQKLPMTWFQVSNVAHADKLFTHFEMTIRKADLRLRALFFKLGKR